MTPSREAAMRDAVARAIEQHLLRVFPVESFVHNYSLDIATAAIAAARPFFEEEIEEAKDLVAEGYQRAIESGPRE